MGDARKTRLISNDNHGGSNIINYSSMDREFNCASGFVSRNVALGQGRRESTP